LPFANGNDAMAMTRHCHDAAMRHLALQCHSPSRHLRHCVIAIASLQCVIANDANDATANGIAMAMTRHCHDAAMRHMAMTHCNDAMAMTRHCHCQWQ